MIAAQAGVSSRTFFNYFPSKEDAALGLRPLHVPAPASESFFDGDGDLFERAVRLTMAVIRTAVPDDGLGERRSELIRTLPELRETEHRWGLGWSLNWAGETTAPWSFGHGGATGTLVGADPVSGLAWAIFTTRPGAPLTQVAAAIKAALV